MVKSNTQVYNECHLKSRISKKFYFSFKWLIKSGCFRSCAVVLMMEAHGLVFSATRLSLKIIEMVL